MLKGPYRSVKGSWIPPFMVFFMFVYIALIAECVAGCGDQLRPSIDGGWDSAIPVDAAPDVDMSDAEDCCALWPDTSAIIKCVNLPPCTCGVIVCHPGGETATINACGPQCDAGVAQ